MNVPYFEYDQFINQEVHTIYENKLTFNNIIFNCIIKKETLQNINFVLFSTNDKYEKNLDREKESKNSKFYFDLISQNSNALNVNIENLFENEATLRINICERDKITSAIYIYLQKSKQETKIGKDKILDYDVDELIKKCKDIENNKEFYIDNQCQFLMNCYDFTLNNNKKYIVFISTVNVIIIKKKQKIHFKIRTNYEIKSKLKDYKINIKNLYVKEKKLLDVIDTTIGIYVEEDQLLLNYIENIEVYKIKFNKAVLELNKDYYPKEYSEYFNDYFNIETPNEKFIYKKTDERKKVKNNFIRLFRVENVKKYLITGPFASGKSITLFILSRILNNVIYINLKILKANQENKEKCLNIIFSEFCRLNIDEKKFNEKFEDFNFNQNILGQLLDAIEIVLNSSNSTIILILDQYKVNHTIIFLTQLFSNLKFQNQNKILII